MTDGMLWRGRCGTCGRSVVISGPTAMLPKHQAKGGAVCHNTGAPAAVAETTHGGVGKHAKASKTKVKDKARNRTGTTGTARQGGATARTTALWDGSPSVSVRTVSGGLPGLGKRR
jgi:hypothetical protein